MSEETDKGAMHARVTGQADYSSGDAYIASKHVLQEKENIRWIASSGTGGSAMMGLIFALMGLFLLFPFLGVYSTANNVIGTCNGFDVRLEQAETQILERSLDETSAAHWRDQIALEESACNAETRYSSRSDRLLFAVNYDARRSIFLENRALDIILVLGVISAGFVAMARYIGPDLGSFAGVAIFASAIPAFKGMEPGEALMPFLGFLFGVLAGHLAAGHPRRWPGTWIERHRRRFLVVSALLSVVVFVTLSLALGGVSTWVEYPQLVLLVPVVLGGAWLMYLGLSHLLRKFTGLGRS